MTNPNPYQGTGHDDSGQAFTQSPPEAPLAPAESRDFETDRSGLVPAGQRPEDPAEPSKPSGGLTDEEIAEFRRLRQEDNARTVAAREAADKAEREKPPVSHYLHLANGEVVESAGTMTHYGPDSIPVVGSYPIEVRGEDK